MPISIICPVCGDEFKVQPNRLLREQPNPPCCSRSCSGRIRVPSRTRHGHCRRTERSKEFVAWHNMKVRCYFEKAESYKRYGARGITVCDRWLESFENFLEDVGESPSPDYTIGRIDNDGNYEPGNVEWQSLKQQCNNRRSTRLITAFKRTQTLQQWSDETGFSPTAITTRIDECGWDAERALSEPKRKQTRPAGNKRVITFRNVTQTLAAWGRSTGIPPSTIARRIDVFGWTVERALTTDNREYHDGSK